MSNVITQEQKKIIVQLTADDRYCDALLAYGSDMYQDGVSFGASMIESLYEHDLTKGFVLGAVSIGIISISAFVACKLCDYNNHKKKKEESES